MVGGNGSNIHAAIAPRVVFFGHEHVERTVLGQKAGRVAVLDALLTAGTVLFAVFSDLQITREIDYLPHQCNGLAGLWLVIHSGGNGSSRPRLSWFGPDRGHLACHSSRSQASVAKPATADKQIN